MSRLLRKTGHRNIRIEGNIKSRIAGLDTTDDIGFKNPIMHIIIGIGGSNIIEIGLLYRIIGFDNIIGADNILRCKIILNSQIILTESIQKRPFQGWRYFKQEEVPNDRELYSEDKIEIPLEFLIIPYSPKSKILAKKEDEFI